jgi:Uma2 family endonuclease
MNDDTDGAMGQAQLLGHLAGVAELAAWRYDGAAMIPERWGPNMATVTRSRVLTTYTEVTLHNVEYATYSKLRDEPANDRLRMIYLDGTLTIMSPHLIHDYDSRMFMIVVMAVARVCRIDFMPIGTTSLKKKGRAPLQGAGKESDEGFFLRENAARMRPKQELDLAIDPPPDLAIEIDNTVNSEAALAIYARIGVPEVWRFDVTEQTLWFGILENGDHYQGVERSLGFPRLTPELVTQALEACSEAKTFLDWLDWLDAWARNLPEAN